MKQDELLWQFTLFE